jgi:hypothetical protein
MSKSTPEKNIFPAGQNIKIGLSSAEAAVFIMVVQKAIASYADDLAARADFNPKGRLKCFDEFVSKLVIEAKNAPIERMTEIGEASAKANVCSWIGTVSQHPRRLLSS